LTQVDTVHQLSWSQLDMQRPVGWAQAPVIFFDFAANAGDNDARPSIAAIAAASPIVVMVLRNMEQASSGQINSHNRRLRTSTVSKNG
jgi:hypothetical protein